MKDSSEVMLVEKYRPESLDQVIGHEDAVNQLQKWVDDPSVPHMLFSGPAGTGKTATITAFAKEKYGEGWKNNVMSLNASDERGIDVIRDKVKKFARQSTAVGSNADYKIIHLDEADSLTSSAQPALRRIMERYSDSTRFMLTCNYQNKILDPILSRCAIFNFQPLSDDEIKQFLDRVVEGEGINVAEDQLWDLVEHSGGDARRAVNTLQAAETDGYVSSQSIDALVSVVDEQKIESIIDDAVAGDYGMAMEELDGILKSGIDTDTICDTMLNVIKDKDWPPDSKIKAIDKVGTAEWRLLNGANPNVQFNSLLADLHICRHISLSNYESEAWSDEGH